MLNQSGGKIICPVCGLKDDVALVDSEDFGRFLQYDCKRCGRYKITDSAKRITSEAFMMHLSSWIREKHDQNFEVPMIDTDLVKNINSITPTYNPSQKQLVLLRKLAWMTGYPGKKVKVNRKFDFVIAWASCEDEFQFYIKALSERNLINTFRGDVVEYQITTEGWNFLDEHEKISIISDQAFVAMSFDKSMDSVWENGIRVAIDKAGYKPYRVNAEPHNEKIDNKIMAEIKNSFFLVADFTEQKRGVYFEAGYALGLGIPVIWSVREDDLKNVHFDTRQYGHIVWTSESNLQEQLYVYICAIIGKKNPSKSLSHGRA